MSDFLIIFAAKGGARFQRATYRILREVFPTLALIPSTFPTMLPPTESPVHALVSTWFNQPPPITTTPLRILLFTAATEEIRRLQAQGRVYDPLADNRFRWAAQWLDLGDHCIERIDSDLQTLAGFILNPPRQAHDFLPA